MQLFTNILSIAAVVCGYASAVGARVPTVALDVLATRHHDAAAFTQGLLYHQGFLYESTGQFGESTLRKVVPTTGEVVALVELDPSVFAEGLARVDNRLIQLTWQSEVAFVYDLATLAVVGSHTYSGEGWGLCYDGSRLVMSNGSNILTFRNPDTFAQTGRLSVTRDGAPVTYLNELECVGDHIYANQWYSDSIYEIEAHTGEVTAIIDASPLVPDLDDQEAVLNGIAYDPQRQTLFVTGKRWPVLYEARVSQFTPAASRTERPAGCSSTITHARASLTLALLLARRRKKTPSPTKAPPPTKVQKQ